LRDGVFNAWFITLSFATTIHLLRSNPSLLTEKIKPDASNQKGWDKYLVPSLVIGFLIWIIIMPLDAKRFGWSAGFPLWLKILGGTILLPSSFFLYRANSDNAFVSPLVRIQEERSQTVISTGVYGFVRHPMYLGGVLLLLGTPKLLGSYFGFIVSGLMALLLIVRIVGEEAMLVEELKGYADYREKVKYRLLPYIW